MQNPFEVLEARLNNIESILIELKHPSPQSIIQPQKDLMTRKEVCALLSINFSTLWKHTKSGKLKSFGIGNRVFYSREQVLQAVKPLNF
jgi:predicted DNA-binding transcriptional regulator AlpA